VRPNSSTEEYNLKGFPLARGTTNLLNTKDRDCCRGIPDREYRRGQSKMENPEKLATYGTQEKERQSKNTTCVAHHYTQSKHK
jgi:hypothetical protein